MFSYKSHIRFKDGFWSTTKVTYNTLESAQKAATSMGKKHNKHFSSYKCVFCDGYHIGRNKDNK